MKRKPFDPLNFIPSAAVLREKLAETNELSRRLSVLLEVAERIEDTNATPSAPAAAPRKAVAVA